MSTKAISILLICVLVLYLHVMYHLRFKTMKELTDILLPAAAGGDKPLPDWLRAACPEIVEHFTRFPYFGSFTRIFSVMTTEFAAHSVCSVVVAVRLAAQADAQLYLHAGSHIGAVLHAGPIPWDDDVDLFLPYESKNEFLRLCRLHAYLHPHASLECLVGWNALKLSIVTNSSMRTARGWYSPFVDIFLLQVRNGRVVEVSPDGSPKQQSYRIDDYFPSELFYFGGTLLLGPQAAIPLNRYNASRCVASCFHHRIERNAWCRGNYEVDCTKLATRFPFLVHGKIVDRKGVPLAVWDKQATNASFALSKWRNDPPRSLKSIPNLNVVEIDNSVSFMNCSASTLNRKTLQVVHLCGDRFWRRMVEVVELLRIQQPDVVFLSEADLGLTRSDQQHIARTLAFALCMNYAWVPTNVENSSEQPGFIGVIGTAILSKCPLVDPLLVRHPSEEYLTTSFLARVTHFGNVVVLGSVQTTNPPPQIMRAYLKDYKTIIGGEHAHNNSCTAMHLTSRGSAELCSDLALLQEELPCLLNPWREKVCAVDLGISSASFALP